jgi:hypothetical protein
VSRRAAGLPGRLALGVGGEAGSAAAAVLLLVVAQEAEIVGGGEREGRGIGRQGKEGVPEEQLLLQAGEGLACACKI